jgi:NAD(P)H dehydrogenase (quinone)
MKKNILLILGHPDTNSFCNALLNSYKKGAEDAKYNVKVLKIGELNFDPILHNGYRKIQELEPDLVRAQEEIIWADHMVWIYPTWWSSLPALLKGFLDRIMLPGFGFKFHKNSPLWDKLLTGKTAEIIVTMDGPVWFYWFKYGFPGIKVLKKAIFNFCGIKVTRVVKIDNVKNKNKKQLQKELKQIYKLGNK